MSGVPDELVERFLSVVRNDDRNPDSRSLVSAALGAVADDLRAEARRECAAELRAAVKQGETMEGTGFSDGYLAVESDELRALADSWDPR